MPTTTAVNASLTATNAALAAQAAEDALQARIERCKVELLQYTPQTASVAQMQSYAECVQIVHPKEESDPVFWKWFVAIAMIYHIVAFLVGWLRDGDLESGVAYAFCAFGLGGVVLLFGLGIAFVVS